MNSFLGLISCIPYKVKGTLLLSLVVSSIVITSAPFAYAAGTYDNALLMPSEGGEGTSFNDGASWDYYNKGAKLKWTNQGGDYIDVNGTNQGSSPWAIQTIVDTNSVTNISWDVSDLVSAWVTNDYENRGFFVKQISGSNGPIDYASKEVSDTSMRPVLRVTTENSGDFTFSPEGDTTLKKSSKTATLGQGTDLRIRNKEDTVLIWFDLEELNGKSISNAQLQLTTVAQYTNSDTVHGVFAVKTSEWDNSAPILGIAAQYSKDRGILTHPDVYENYSYDKDDNTDSGDDNYINSDLDSSHADNFWNCDSLSPSGKQSDGSLSSPSLAIPGYHALNDGNALCMRVQYEEGSKAQGRGNYGASIREQVSDFLDTDQTDELFVRTYIFLGDTWGENIINENGKRPGGITGTQANTAYEGGWGGRTTDGSNGWSARGGYSAQVPYGNNPLEGYTPISTYLYHADQVSSYGDVFHWDMSPNYILQKGRWYSVEQQVKMNTRDGENIVGSSGSNDGIVRGWIDGRLVFEKTDIRFTDMDYINIQVADLGLYYGGAGNTPYDQHLAIDNVVISKSYIGPMTDTEYSGPPIDVVLPAVDISAPQISEAITNDFLFQANASDNVEVSGVQFKLDGVDLGDEDKSRPYSVLVNTTELANGSHTITAAARDSSGNIKISDSVTFQVANVSLSLETQVVLDTDTSEDDSDNEQNTSQSESVGNNDYDDSDSKRSQLLAKIESLLAQIAQLEEIILARKNGLSKKHVFTRSFTNGDEHDDVRVLQQKLNALGFIVSNSGLGSINQETNHYGPRTTRAIQKFQCRYDIVCSGAPESTGYGNFGPKTRAKIMSL